MKQSKIANRSSSPVFCLIQAAWWGLLSGMIEVAVITGKSFSTPIMNMGREFVWMTPLAAMALLLLPGMLFFLLRLTWKKGNPWGLMVFFCSLLAVFNLLILIPGLHHVAALLLAGGVATQISHYAKQHMEGFETLVRGTLPWMIGLVLVLGLGVQVRKTTVEKRSLAALPAAPSGAPNVLFITLDTVRASSLSVYGYTRRTTPNLEALGQTGVVFDSALSTASWTLPSHAGMFTGHAYHEMSADWHIPLDGTYPTLAEYLSHQGYSAAGFVANMGYCSYETGLSRGFTHYEDYPISLGQIAWSSTIVRTIADNFRIRRLIQNDELLNRKTADQVNENVLDWLDRPRTRPFFVFLNYLDAHDPYFPPAPFDKKFGPGRRSPKASMLHHWLYNPALGHRDMDEATIQEEHDAYDNALAYLDDRLGALFSALKERKLWGNTIVIITADHGEEFGEHRLFSHGNSLYLSSVHVPLIISFPGRTPEGKRIQTPVSLRDLPSTVVAMLNPDNKTPFPGASLSRFWNGDPAADASRDEPLLSELNHASNQPDWFPVSKGNMKSLVFHGLRYIKNGDGVEELYDFNSDPWEHNNLASSAAYRDNMEQFRSQLRRILGN